MPAWEYEMFMKEINEAVKEENERNKQENDKYDINSIKKMSNPNNIRSMQNSSMSKVPNMGKVPNMSNINSSIKMPKL